MGKHFSSFISLTLFSVVSFSQQKKNKIIDADATKETKALYYNLGKLSEKHILFGHHMQQNMAMAGAGKRTGQM